MNKDVPARNRAGNVLVFLLTGFDDHFDGFARMGMDNVHKKYRQGG